MEPLYPRQPHDLTLDENTQLMAIYQARLAALRMRDRMEPEASTHWKHVLIMRKGVLVTSVYILLAIGVVYRVYPSYLTTALFAAVAVTLAYWLWLRMNVQRLRKELEAEAWQYARQRVNVP